MLGIPINLMSASDIKPESRRWINHFFPEVHTVYDDLRNQLRDGPRDNAAVDLLCMGTPCTPFTLQRPNHGAVPAHQHVDYNITMEVGRTLARFKPSIAIFEQVASFEKYMEEWLDDISDHLRTADPSLIYMTQVLSNDSSFFAAISRPRLVTSVGLQYYYYSFPSSFFSVLSCSRIYYCSSASCIS
jgi:site-specific DNA-cytosine methylase